MDVFDNYTEEEYIPPVGETGTFHDIEAVFRNIKQRVT
jgi:hypothetical protein